MTDSLRDHLQTALGDAYRLDRELGGGGMSRVFVAHEETLDRDVVVKVLSPELSIGISAERFAREIRLAAMLQEPHIVPIHTTGMTTDGLPYFTMPFVSGQSLRHRLAQGKLPMSEAIGILRDIARALQYAHSHGVVHRDIKPENVLLSEGTAVVTDFGIAKAVSESQTLPGTHGLTASGMSIGTPAYMAPEQAAADPAVDHRADVYSWGMIAYELLAGAHPFAHRTSPQQLLTAQMSEVPFDLRDERFRLPAALATLVMRCLSKDPEQRPSSIKEVLGALDSRLSIAQRVSERRSPILLIVAAMAVLAVAAFAITRKRGAETATATTTDQSVAVLPFTVLGRDTSEAYLADGMTDELAAQLSKVTGLRVAARRSAYTYRNTTTPPGEIGRALNVGMLLDGTVQRMRDRIRVRAQLTNVRDGGVLWSDTFEGDARDLFALQDTITSAIVSKLRLRLASATPAEQAGVRPKNMDAHDLYLRGRFEAGRHTEAGLLAAIALFKEAVAKDSTYAPPWVGMADAYGWLADSYSDPLIVYPQAKAAVTHAIELAPMLAEAHAVLGWILLAHDWNFIGAESELRRAVTLDPNSALAHSNYSYAFLHVGRPAEGLAEIRKAIALDPLTPSYSANLEWHLLLNRQYEAAVEQHKVTARLDPAYFFGDSWAAAALRELKRYPESIEMYRAVESLQGVPPFGLAVTYARMGDTVQARAILRQLLERSRKASVSKVGIAQIYAALGDADHAIEWLEKAYAARSNATLEAAYAPMYDPLRKDPRFMNLMQRVGLEPKQ